MSELSRAQIIDAINEKMQGAGRVADPFQGVRGSTESSGDKSFCEIVAKVCEGEGTKYLSSSG